MIGVNGVVQNNGFQQRAYRLADHTIIDSPPFVLGTRIETELHQVYFAFEDKAYGKNQ